MRAGARIDFELAGYLGIALLLLNLFALSLRA